MTRRFSLSMVSPGQTDHPHKFTMLTSSKTALASVKKSISDGDVGGSGSGSNSRASSITLTMKNPPSKKGSTSLGPSPSCSSSSSKSSSICTSHSSSEYATSLSSLTPSTSIAHSYLGSSSPKDIEFTPTAKPLHRARPHMRRSSSTSSVLSSSSSQSTCKSDERSHPDWQDSVPQSVLRSLKSHQILRQSVIHEIICGEADYVEDLLTYQTIFINKAQDLTPPAIFQPSQLESFTSIITSSLGEVIHHNTEFLKKLLQRKSQESPVIEKIGDVIFNSCLNWGESYIKYSKNHPIREQEIQKLMKSNPLFSELVQMIPKLNSRRKDFRHFYSRPTFRLARYILLFKRLLDLTPNEHPDHELVQLSLDLVKQQTSDCDSVVRAQEDYLELVNLDEQIIHRSEFPLLHLQSHKRQVYWSGTVARKKDAGPGLTEWSEVFLVLLDNYLLILKPKKDDQQRFRYAIVEKPIRIEFIKITSMDGPAEKRSRRLKNLLSNVGSINGNTTTSMNSQKLRRAQSEPGASPLLELSLSSSSRNMYPFTIQSFGTCSKVLSFYVESESRRSKWIEQFGKSIENRLRTLKSSQVFELRPLTRETFSVPSQPRELNNPYNLNPTQLPSLAELKSIYGDQIPKELLPKTLHYGPPTCSVPFFTPDGRRFVAIGSPQGLWVGKANDPTSIRQALPLKDVVQCSVLQEHNYMVVLAGKALLAYPLELLIPLSRASTCGTIPEVKEKPNRPAIGYQEALQISQKFSLGKFDFESKKLPKSAPPLLNLTPGISPSSSSTNTPDRTAPSTPTIAFSPNFQATTPPRCNQSSRSVEIRSQKRLSQLNQANLQRKDPIRLSPSGTQVDFFRVGKLGDRMLLIYAEKGLKKTEFRVWELTKEANRTVFLRHPDFMVGFEVDGIEFHKTRMKLELMNGSQCQVMNMESLTSDSTPHLDSLAWIGSGFACNSLSGLISNQQAILLQLLKKKIEGSKLLKIAQVDQKEYLFCYDSFAYFANKNGDPIAKKIEMMIEWDEKLEKVVKISHYMLGLSEKVIEIWDLRNSERVQSIHGKDIECTYDGHLNDFSRLGSSSECDWLPAMAHVSIRDSGQVCRVFEMRRMTE